MTLGPDGWKGVNPLKLRWYDRVLVSLGGLVLAALGVCVMLSAGGILDLSSLFAFDVWLGDGWQWMPLIFLAGLLLAAWGVWLFVRPMLRSRDTAGKYYTVQDSGEGGVHISVQALDHLVHRCLSIWPEILTAQVRIGGQEDAMRITLRTTLRSDVRIPDLIGEVRQEIKSYVEECSGVKVESVRVIVEATKEDKDQPGIGPAPRRKEEPAALPETLRKEPEPEAAAEPEAPRQEPDPVVKRFSEEEKIEPVILPETKNPETESSEADRPDAEAMEADLGPEAPPPVELSKDAFPFPGEGIPAESLDGASASDSRLDEEAEGPDMPDAEEETHNA